MRRTALLALLLAACGGAGVRSLEGPAPVRLRGLDFSARLDAAASTPTRLSGEVRVENRGGVPETLVFANGCPVGLRIYEVRGERMAPVWETPRECRDEPVALAIAAGDAATLPIPVANADEVLGTGLPDGSYRVTVWLAPEDRVIEIEAGEVDLRRAS